MREEPQQTLFRLDERQKRLLKNFIYESTDTNARRHLQRVLECGENHLLFATPGGYEIAPMSCNSRWCEKCAHHRSLEMARWLSVQFQNLHVQRTSIINNEVKNWSEKVSKKDLRHFIFTIKSIPYFKLRHALDRFRVFIRQATKMLQEKEAVYIWKIEIVFKPRSVHPHIHFAINRYIDINWFHQYFRRNIKPFYSKIKYSKKVECSLYEFTKYTTKPSSWDNITEKYFQYVWFSFQRRRVIGCSRQITLLPKEYPLGWKLLGSLERIMTDEKSDYRAIAFQLYEEKIKAKRK